MPAGRMKLLDVPFPIRGVNRNAPRSNQPPKTCFDALNVLPYERYGRARGGTRPGTAKLWAAAIGGPSPVLNLTQTTIALDPSTVTADVQQLNEPFTYGNGNLDTVSAAAWRTSQSSGTGSPGVSITQDSTKMVVASNAATSGAAFPQNNTASIYQPALTIGAAYVIKCDINLPAAATNAQQQDGGGIVFRQDKTNYASTTNTWHVAFNRAGVKLIQGITDVPPTGGQFTFGTQLAAGVHTLEVRVNGDVMQVWVDGVMYLSFTSSAGNTNVGLGFMFLGAINTNGITFDNFQVFTGKNLASYRQTNLVAVAGGNIYMGDNLAQATLVGGGTAQLYSTARAQSAYSAGKMYLVDGLVIRKLNLTTRSMEAYAATAGTPPTNCTLACMYRDRLCLAAARDNPQNFFFSRVGTQTDWDYSQTDPAAAFAGNASVAGRIGEPIVALIPFSDDELLIAGDHCLWIIRGDPAAGGSIDLVSDAVGILGPNAWCKDPTGIVYFVGTGGLFRMAPGAQSPELLSNTTYNQYFASINRGSNYVLMAWDRDRHGCYIFNTPVNPTGNAGTHLWFDTRTGGGFWPQQYPDSHGPSAVLVYDGDGPTDRKLLLGGRTGFVQIKSEIVRNDDGVAINSYVVIGPFEPFGPIGETVLQQTDIDLGEVAVGDAANVWNCNFEIRAGRCAYDVTEGAPASTISIGFPNAGKQATWMQRIRGAWLALKIYNAAINNYWSFENCTMTVEFGGRAR